MKDPLGTYYFAAWTEHGCLLGCDHMHNTVTSAAECDSISRAGSYVVAVQHGVYRALNDPEESEFRQAIRKPLSVPVLKYEASGYAVMVPVRFVDGWGWSTWLHFETYQQAHAHAQGNKRIVRFGSSEWRVLCQKREPTLPETPVAPLESQAPRHGDETLVDYVSRLIASPLEKDILAGKEAPLGVTNEDSRPTFIDNVLEWINQWELKILEQLCALVVRVWLDALRRRVLAALREKSHPR